MTAHGGTLRDAPLSGRDVRLVPLAPEHVPYLRSLELNDRLAFRWRHAGQHPSPEAYAAALWADTLCQFLVVTGGDHAPPLGLVSAYAVDLRAGHCRLAAARFSEGVSVAFMRGIFLMTDYLFMGWPFRKLYLETPEYNLDQFGRAMERLVTEEARLRDHVFLDGRHWDLLFLAVTRECWNTERRRLDRFIGGAATSATSAESAAAGSAGADGDGDHGADDERDQQPE